jgi:hypothetical protein
MINRRVSFRICVAIVFSLIGLSIFAFPAANIYTASAVGSLLGAIGSFESDEPAAKSDGRGPEVSIATLGVPITQNFDTLASSGSPAWTDNSTISGWYAQFGGGSSPTTYTAGTGSSATGALYSFGVAGANPVTDRALGGVSSGSTLTIQYAIQLTNNTGTAITSVDVSFVGEQWRNGGNLTAQQVEFQYQVANTGVIVDANEPTTGG